MRNHTTHSRTSLFLIEMLFSLGILALVATVCIQVFAAAHTYRRKAREENHIQEIVISVGEILEGSNGDSQSFLDLLPGGTLKDDTLSWFYDKNWNSCEEPSATYCLTLTLSCTDRQKKASLVFTSFSGTQLYSQDILYPVPLSGEGVFS